MKKQTERRKHKRFQPIAGLFAVLSSKDIKMGQIKFMSMTEIALKFLKAKPIKMGQIIDISKGGLAFWYIHTEESTIEPSKIAITFAENAFYSDNMKFETISEFEIVEEDQLNTFTIRRQGLKFKGLTLKQASLLDYIIRKYTMSEVGANYLFNNWVQSSLMDSV